MYGIVATIGIAWILLLTTVSTDAFAETDTVTISKDSGTRGCEVANRCYDPSTINVIFGTTVIWTNNDAVTHTVTSTTFDSGLIKPGGTFEHTFDQAGEFPYLCTFHAWMTGKVIVEDYPVSVAMKHKKKVTLAAVKNNGDEEIFGVQMKIDDGKITFADAKGWERSRIDQSSVIVKTGDRPIMPGKSLIMILRVDNRTSSFEWTVFDAAGNIMAKGDVGRT